MRKLLLAVIAVAWMLPDAADAARRDERGRQQVSRPAQAQVVKANPAAKAAPQAPRAAAPSSRPAVQPRVAVQRGAPARTPAAATGRSGRTLTTGRGQERGRALAAARSAGPRHAMHRPGEARSRNVGFLMRSASAATISRDAMSSCSRRNGRTVCAARDTDGVAGWQAGLPPVDYAQRACPAGTFATLARGHDDVVRCMPI
jgi:hypothetical protein